MCLYYIYTIEYSKKGLFNPFLCKNSAETRQIYRVFFKYLSKDALKLLKNKDAKLLK